MAGRDARAREVLATVQRAVFQGRAILTGHAQDRMAERGVSTNDLRDIAMSAKRAVPDGKNTWLILDGIDDQGVGLTLVAEVDDDVVVITVKSPS